MIVALNHGILPVKPLKAVEIQTKRTGAIATIAQKTDLVKAELALGCSIDLGMGEAVGYPPGTVLYLVPDAAFQTWNKTIFNIDGVEFVRVPIQFVLGIELQLDKGH